MDRARNTKIEGLVRTLLFIFAVILTATNAPATPSFQLPHSGEDNNLLYDETSEDLLELDPVEALALIENEDRESIVALARRCRDKGRHDLYDEIVRQATSLWPDHPQVKFLQGQLPYEGQWIEVDDWIELRGFRKFDNQWYPPESLIRFEGELLPIQQRDHIAAHRRDRARELLGLPEQRTWENAITLESQSSLFRLRTDAGATRGLTVLSWLETFQQELQIPFLDLRARTPILVDLFRTRESFLRDSRLSHRQSAENMLGYYIAGENHMLFYDRPQDPEGFSTVVRHEAVHAFIDQSVTGKMPRWIHEGLATYFAARGNHPILDSTEAIYLTQLNDAFQTGTAPSLGDLARERDFSPMDYAASWSLVHWFCHERRLGHGFAAFLDSEYLTPAEILEDVDPVQSLFECLQIDATTFHVSWARYVNALLEKHERCPTKAAAYADLARRQLDALGPASAARAKAFLARARDMIQRSPESGDERHRAELAIALATMGVNLREDPRGLPESVARVIDAAQRAIGSHHAKRAHRHFQIGQSLLEGVELLLGDMEGELSIFEAWTFPRTENPSPRWNDRVLTLQRRLNRLPPVWENQPLQYRVETVPSLAQDLGRAAVRMLHDATLMAPPYGQAVGKLLQAALTVVPDHLDDARDSLAFLAEVDRSDDLHIWSAQLALHDDDSSKALSHLLRALALEPTHPVARSLLSEVQ